MSAMKRFAEAVSEEMGLGGAITDAVLAESNRIRHDPGLRHRVVELFELAGLNDYRIVVCPTHYEGEFDPLCPFCQRIQAP